MRRSILALVTILFLAPLLAVANEPLAVLFGDAFTQKDVDEYVKWREIEIAEDDDSEVTADALFDWASNRLDEKIRTTPVPLEAVQKQLEWEQEAGLIPPFSELHLEYDTQYQAAIARVSAMDEPTEEELQALYEEVAPSFPEDMPLEGTQWYLIKRIAAKGGNSIPYPQTEEEYLAKVEAAARFVVQRRAIADRLIDSFYLMESEELIAKTKETLEQYNLDMPVDEALRSILQQRELQRWGLIVMREHCEIPGDELLKSFEEILEHEEQRLEDFRVYSLSPEMHLQMALQQQESEHN